VVLTSRWPSNSWTVADVPVLLEQVGRERVAERVAGRAVRDAGLTHGVLERALQDRLVEVVDTALARHAVNVESE
jgi:hypothetical protein